MKLLPLAFATTLFFSGVAAAKGLDVCKFESDYQLRLTLNALTFHRDQGAPADIEMRAGRLLLDGRDVALSAADRERVRRFEHAVRALVPEVKAIALEGVGIATEALSHVVAGFGGKNSAETLKKMQQLSDEMVRRIESSDDSGDWDDAQFERLIGSLTAELVPAMVGDVTAIALEAALSGDESAAKALEARMEKMEAELEVQVEKRSKALEARAERLCPRVAELDVIETSLELRLADNRPIDLLHR